MNSVVAMIILGSGVLFATIGAGLLVVGEPLTGAIFVAVGVSDAIVALIIRRRIETRGPSASAQPVARDAGEADPSHNPYARED